MAPDAPVVEVDTEGAVTGDGPAGSAGTANPLVDTSGSGPAGHLSSYVLPVSPAVTGVDTSGANGGTATVPDHSAVSLLNTLAPGTGGIPEANPAYRAPSGPVAALTKDTTLTDKQPGGSATTPVDSANNMTSSPDSYSIGATGSGTGTTAPAAPTSVTSVTGDHGVVVSWTAPSDPSGDPVTGYEIYCVEDQGVVYAPRGATSKYVDWLSEDRLYTFYVVARNKKGLGVKSAVTSPAVRPYNNGAPDVNDPYAGKLRPGNRVNAVYGPSGSIKPGTGGTNGVPGSVAAAAGAGASKQITVTWTAPTIGTTPTGYHIVCSDGTTYDVGAVLTTTITFGASGGAAKSFKVNAVNGIGSGEQSASSNAVVSP